MLLGGDEFNRTQQGNNNAYCQDNEVSWFAWDHDDAACQMIDYVARLSAIRRENPILRRRRFFRGRPATPAGFKDVSWIRPDGNDMVDADWWSGLPTLGLRLAGDAIEETDIAGRAITTPNLMLIIHAGDEATTFTLPAIDRDEAADTWQVILDTDDPIGDADAAYKERDTIPVPARTVMVLRGGGEATTT